MCIVVLFIYHHSSGTEAVKHFGPCGMPFVKQPLLIQLHSESLLLLYDISVLFLYLRVFQLTSADSLTQVHTQ
jgi:hypothetical protein